LYTLRGELAIGAARLQVNLTQYFHAVQYRKHTLIDDLVFQSSSLSAQQNAVDRSLLITGVGRSGTTFICQFLNRLGWNVSHDNGIDCGPFPGLDGASSWYHAFRLTNNLGILPLRAKKVVHLIRNPLATVKSRMARIQNGPPYILNFTYKVAESWEDVQYELESLANDTMIASFALTHWVNRNSFVSKLAQWRVAIEDLASDPLHTWMLGLEVGRDDCPALGTIRPILQSMNQSANTNGKVNDASLDDMIWWGRLADVAEDSVRIALKMASEYGYNVEHRLEERFRVSAVNYSCQFRNDEAARSSRESPHLWGCYLTTS
jgi:hypothetical protein